MKKLRSRFIKDQSTSHFKVPTATIIAGKFVEGIKLVPNPRYYNNTDQTRGAHMSKKRERGGLTGKQYRKAEKAERRRLKAVNN